jgi:hypothetical protein
MKRRTRKEHPMFSLKNINVWNTTKPNLHYDEKLTEHLNTSAYLLPICHDTPMQPKASRYIGFGTLVAELVYLLGHEVRSITKPLSTQTTQTQKAFIQTRMI